MSIITDRIIAKRAPGATGGSAALEALMLVVFLFVPIWILLFNMGYAGARLQDAQSAARMAALEVLGIQTDGEDAQSREDDIAAQVSGRLFPREENEDTVELAIENVDLGDALGPDNDDFIDILGDVVGALSGNTRVTVSVTRKSPFEQFADTPITVPLVVGGTPYTYCEMDNATFNPLAGENVGLGILETITGSASYILAPFGGLPSGSDKC